MNKRITAVQINSGIPTIITVEYRVTWMNVEWPITFSKTGVISKEFQTGDIFNMARKVLEE